MQRIHVLNGPNLNLLGGREPEIYGTATLADVTADLEEYGTRFDVAVAAFQSNHEGAIIDELQRIAGSASGIILNAGALTHTSYAIHDAIVATGCPTVEVHISNIHAREDWRRRSVLAPACVHTIFGRGARGYRDALSHLVQRSAWPTLTIPYASGTEHIADLRVPDAPGPHPVAVLIHGGFWRDVWTRDLMDAIAVDLTRQGWATWNIEYHRVGAGGGWPETIEDVAEAIDALAGFAAENDLDLERVVTIGHSAGGHLALWAAARQSLPPDAPGAVPQVPVFAAVGLAPVANLGAAHARSLGSGAVEDFLRRSPSDGAGRYAVADPALLLPLGVRQVIIHGDVDDEVPVELSETYAGLAADAGDAVAFHELRGVGHYELIDPMSKAWTTVVAELNDLR
jgi:3-dehydroquinate dehydratase type II